MSKQTGVGVVTGLSHEGRGIAHIEGKTTFIDGGLPGEEVEFEYLKRKGRYDEAKVIRVIQASPDRELPPCEFFGLCGGCSLQHMSPSAQITHKQQVLLEQLQHIGGVKPETCLPAVRAHELGYRRKARLGVRYVTKKEKLLIGFREKNGRYLAEMDSCAVLHPSIGQKLPLLGSLIMSLENYAAIPQLEIAVGDDATAIIIRHLTPLPLIDLQRITEFAKTHDYVIYLQPGGPNTVHLHYPADGRPRLSYRFADHPIEMLFSPVDFTQVNAEINNKMVNLALDLLAPRTEEKFLDLFCGIGNFTLPLAKRCQSVLGIEGSDLMVERGYENAQHNGIENVSFQCQDLSVPQPETWLEQKFAGVLLDPPRTGAWDIVQVLPALGASRIVYISCNPATLARDAGYLCQQGYRLTSVGVLDMFPHTSHVESIALFTKD